MRFDSLLNNGHFLFIFFHGLAISTKINKFPKNSHKFPSNSYPLFPLYSPLFPLIPYIPLYSPLFLIISPNSLSPHSPTSNSTPPSVAPPGKPCFSPSRVPSVSSTRFRPPSRPTRFLRLNVSEHRRRWYRHRTSECGGPVAEKGYMGEKWEIEGIFMVF